jgi:putative transposase
MLISLAYRLTCSLLGALATVARCDISKDAELLVLRHENTVLRRHIQRVRYEPEDRLWLSALSSLIPRRRWTEVFSIIPTTLLTWHRRLVANKYTATPHRPGRPPTRAVVKALVIGGRLVPSSDIRSVRIASPSIGAERGAGGMG